MNSSTDARNRGLKKSQKTFMCSKCKKLLASSRNLRQHIISVHAGVAEDLLKSTEKHYNYTCEQCCKHFNNVNNFNYHKRTVHLQPTSKNIHLVDCSLCGSTFDKKTIVQHYEKEHNCEMKTEHFQFEDFSKFVAWKEHMMKENNLKFNLSRTRITPNFKCFYFVCHRSGFYKTNGKGMRRLKTLGSNKINTICPAKINVKQTADGQCVVVFQSTHVGHENDLTHLPLSSSEREMIAGKIASKIPFNVILDKTKDSIFDSKLERLHLLTRKDLHNIKAKLNLPSNVVTDIDDGVSDDGCTGESLLEIDDESHVLFYKPREITLNDNAELKVKKKKLKQRFGKLLVLLTSEECNLVDMHLKSLDHLLGARRLNITKHKC